MNYLCVVVFFPLSNSVFSVTEMFHLTYKKGYMQIFVQSKFKKGKKDKSFKNE